MAGFNFTVNSSRAQKPLLDGDELGFNAILEFKNAQLSKQTWKEYPFEQIVYNEHVNVFVEGYIYNIEIANYLSAIIKLLKSSSFKELAELIKSFDGEFVLIVVDSELDEVYFINDGWGRLPCYVENKNNQLVITRNIDFLLHHNKSSYNKLALSFSLLFGYE